MRGDPDECGHRCFEVGGPFIAEDPDCPVHGRSITRAGFYTDDLGQDSLDAANHVASIVEHDQAFCKLGCTTTHEVRCPCGWGQGASSLRHAEWIVQGHRMFPDYDVIGGWDKSDD